VHINCLHRHQHSNENIFIIYYNLGKFYLQKAIGLLVLVANMFPQSNWTGEESNTESEWHRDFWENSKMTALSLYSMDFPNTEVKYVLFNDNRLCADIT
jgi:hypothetical protein